MLERVISGGQTGADQAGLAAAKACGIPTGGWMPKGFLTTAGPAPELAAGYGLKEHSGGYADRTGANVRDADATIRFAASFQTYGERCTLRWLREHGKPYLDVDIATPPPHQEVADWLVANRVRVLNVAGNVGPKGKRAKAAGITAFVTAYLVEVFTRLGYPPRGDDQPAADAEGASV
jgi:hypothetical protein